MVADPELCEDCLEPLDECECPDSIEEHDRISDAAMELEAEGFLPND